VFFFYFWVGFNQRISVIEMMNFDLDDSGLTFLDSLDKYEPDKVKHHVFLRIKKVSIGSDVL